MSQQFSVWMRMAWISALCLGTMSQKAFAGGTDAAPVSASHYLATPTPVAFPPSLKIRLRPHAEGGIARAFEFHLTLLQKSDWLGLTAPTAGTYKILLAADDLPDDLFEADLGGDSVAFIHDCSPDAERLCREAVGGQVNLYDVRARLFGHQVEGAFIIEAGDLGESAGTFLSSDTPWLG